MGLIYVTADIIVVTVRIKLKLLLKSTKFSLLIY